MKLSPDNDSIVNRPIDKTRTNVLIYDTRGTSLPRRQGKGEDLSMEKKEKLDIMVNDDEKSLQEARKNLIERFYRLSEDEQMEVLEFIEGGALRERCTGHVVLGR